MNTREEAEKLLEQIEARSEDITSVLDEIKQLEAERTARWRQQAKSRRHAFAAKHAIRK